MSVRKRTAHTLRKLRRQRLLQRPTDQGQILKLKRRADREARRTLFARETRHLLGLEKLYTEGYIDPGEQKVLYTPNPYRAAHFKKARETLIKKAEALR